MAAPLRSQKRAKPEQQNRKLRNLFSSSANFGTPRFASFRMSARIWRPTTGSRALPLAKLCVLLISSTIPALARAAPTHALAWITEHDHEAKPGSEGQFSADSPSPPWKLSSRSSTEFVFKVLFSAFLVVIGGLFSGLTLGLMGSSMNSPSELGLAILPFSFVADPPRLPQDWISSI